MVLLLVWREPLVAIPGGLNGETYCAILGNHTLPTLWQFYGMDLCYFHDNNANWHVASPTMAWQWCLFTGLSCKAEPGHSTLSSTSGTSWSADWRGAFTVRHLWRFDLPSSSRVEESTPSRRTTTGLEYGQGGGDLIVQILTVNKFCFSVLSQVSNYLMVDRVCY